MSIEFAILAFLSAGPLSGYDLKKLFAESESFPWSGNNNQVYKALVELHRDGLTSREIQQPAEGPARKLYTMTPAGEASLRSWLLDEPETPALRAPILARLVAADLLSAAELDGLLARYGEELRLKVLGLEELQRRGKWPSFGSERQAVIWQHINDRPIRLLRAEEDWVHELRWAIGKLERTAAQ